MAKTKTEIETETDLPIAESTAPDAISAAADSPIPGTVETLTEATATAPALATIDCIVIRGRLQHDGNVYPQDARVTLPADVATGLIQSQIVIRAEAPS